MSQSDLNSVLGVERNSFTGKRIRRDVKKKLERGDRGELFATPCHRAGRKLFYFWNYLGRVTCANVSSFVINLTCNRARRHRARLDFGFGVSAEFSRSFLLKVLIFSSIYTYVYLPTRTYLSASSRSQDIKKDITQRLDSREQGRGFELLEMKYLPHCTVPRRYVELHKTMVIYIRRSMVYCIMYTACSIPKCYTYTILDVLVLV